jgi:hypothetical protein
MRGHSIIAISAAVAALLAVPAASQTPAAQQPTRDLSRLAAQRLPRPPSVDWQGAVGGARRSAGAAENLGKLDREAIDRTQVPILLPTTPGLIATARIYSFGDYYSITADLPGAGVSLTGTTSVVTLPAKSRLTLDSSAPELLTIQRTVDGQLASFQRYGVLYTVEVRCDDPKDPRCRSEALVRQIIGAATTVVLGKAARQAAGLGG